MSTIVTRAGKGSALTHTEVDNNFINLNTDKIEAAQSVTLTNKTISGSSNTLSNIGNSSLTNSSVTIGSTSVSLGSTATTVSGLTLSSPTVSGGTINNTSVGATTPSTGAFTTLSATGVATFQAGSNSAPAITTSGDTNTGVFFPAADTVAIGTGGTEAMRIDSSGNLGLGVTPSAWGGQKAIQFNYGSFSAGTAIGTLMATNSFYNGTNWIYRISSTAMRYTQDSAGHYWHTAPSGTAGNAITFTQAMTLDASGNLAIRATANNVTTAFNIQEDSGVNLAVFSANETSGEIRIGGVLSNYFPTFYSGNAERARFTNNGYLLLGKTVTAPGTAGITFGATADLGYSGFSRTSSTNAEVTLQVYSTGAAANRFYVGMAGTVFATSTTITEISDVRLKENIRDLDDGLAKVMALQPRKFDWKEGKGANIKDARGFIAQEFEQVFPDMIDQWMDEPPEGEEPYKAVNANLIPTLVKAIQEQQQMIEELKVEVQALKGQA